MNFSRDIFMLNLNPVGHREYAAPIFHLVRNVG